MCFTLYIIIKLNERWSKISILFLTIIAQVRISKWGNWTSNNIPVFHGSYVSNWRIDEVPDEYAYCHIDRVTLLENELYSNGDILLSYNTKVINNPLEIIDTKLNVNCFVKINYITGLTLWAKELIYR